MPPSTIRSVIVGACLGMGLALIGLAIGVTRLNLAVLTPGVTLTVTSASRLTGELRFGERAKPLESWLKDFFWGLAIVGLPVSVLAGAIWAFDIPSVKGWVGLIVVMVALSLFIYMTWRLHIEDN